MQFSKSNGPEPTGFADSRSKYSFLLKLAGSVYKIQWHFEDGGDLA